MSFHTYGDKSAKKIVGLCSNRDKRCPRILGEIYPTFFEQLLSMTISICKIQDHLFHLRGRKVSPLNC